METLKILEELTAELDKKKAVDIKIINIKDISDIADYFLICSANNPNQLRTLQDTVEMTLDRLGIENVHVEGRQNSSWILVDCIDFIVHLFDKEAREFYNLEHMWQDGVDVDITPFLPVRE